MRPAVRQLLMMGAAKKWTPLDLQGLVAWHDASQMSLSCGDNVAQWDDLSGNDNHAIQATPAAQPIFTKNIINGLPALAFVDDDFLDYGATHIGNTGLFAGAGEEFAVFAISRVITGNTGTIIARAEGVASNRNFQVFYNQGTDTPSVNLRGELNRKDLGYDDSDAHLVGVTWDGSDAIFYADGDINRSLAIGDASEDSEQRIIIGARTNGTSFTLQGDIAEIIICDTMPSPADIAKLRNYAIPKWGVAT